MFEIIRDQYPRFAEFEAYRGKQAPPGIFMNDFYSRINGRRSPMAPAKNFVMNQACYCQADDHCPKGYGREEGLVYLEARLCRAR